MVFFASFALLYSRWDRSVVVCAWWWLVPACKRVPLLRRSVNHRQLAWRVETHRILGFDNFWGQRDGIFELYWMINIGLFAICGFAMVTGQERPCFFVGKVFGMALLGLDVVTAIMYW